MEVGCPWARGLQPQLHPQTYQPATQPRAPPPRPAPHYSTRRPEARSPVEVKWTNPRNKEKKNEKKGETLNQESGGMEGNQEKRYATRTPRHATPRHATLTKLRVQRKHNVGTWPAYAPKRHTAGRDSAPMLTNNDKGCKRKHSHATALETANTPPKNAKNARDHSS